METKDYDLVVIGGGPAGALGAWLATMFGKRGAWVEKKQNLGGAGINTGNIPSKTLREAALALTGWRSGNLFGVELSLRRGRRSCHSTSLLDTGGPSEQCPTQ